MNALAASVRHVRWAAPAPPGGARAAFEGWLAGVDPHRYGLPCQALLVLRHVRAPVAGLTAGARHDPLADVARGACRVTQHGCAGTAAAAVWFSDEAELLACLARDVAAGVAGSRWWWTVALGHAPDALAAFRRWLAAPRAVPAALSALPGDWPQLWLAIIGPEGRARLLQALTNEFPISDAVRRAVLAHDLAAPADATGAFRTTAIIAGRRPAPAAEALPPVPLDAVAALLALCETLAAQPLAALDEAFASLLAPAAPVLATLANEQAATEPRPSRAPSVHGRGAGAPAAHPDPTAIERADGATPAAAGRPAVPTVTAHGTAPAAPSTLRRRPPAVAPVGERPVRASVSPADTPAVGSRSDGAPLAAAAPRAQGRPPMQPRPVDPATAASVDTHHAGLFFLLNAAIALGLYGDFTQPRHAGLTLSPWQCLRDAGRAFFGRRFLSDPLAAWLAARAPSPAPRRPPVRWWAGTQALQAFAGCGGRWHAVVGPGGLVLRHPAGFSAAWSSGDGEDLLDGLCAEVGVAPRSVVVHRRMQPPRLPGDEMQSVAPLLAARLSLALGVPARPACALALVLPGRVHAGTQRVDVRMPLAALPLAVRLAGLDRDPGWLPAAGCDIRFHFD